MQLFYRLQRVNIDANEFHLVKDGERLFTVIRETDKEGRRGNWLVFMPTLAGLMIAERNQYSNDIIERCEMHVRGERPFDRKFRRTCTGGEYLEHADTWCAELAFQFGGEWRHEYYEWEGRAILTKVIEPRPPSVPATAREFLEESTIFNREGI